MSVSLPDLPDVGSSLIFQWGEASAFVNRSSATGWRLPEHAMRLPHQGIKPGSLVIKWTSGGVLRTATDNGQGDLQGAATGEINYASAALLLRPQFMIDAGGQFAIEYDYAVVINKNVAVTLDAGGYASITLDTVPAPGTVSVGWITVRNLSASSGASSGGTSASKNGGSGKFSYLPQVPPAPAPVITSRVPLSDGSTTGKYMAQGGTRASGGSVYIEVGATSSPTGNHYVPPDVDGVVWTDAEYTAGVKSIGGVEYRRWGA